MRQKLSHTHADSTTDTVNISALFAGFLLVLLGALVLFGWSTGNLFLIQVYSVFPPMQLNSAVGFFLSGTGICLLSVSRRIPACVLGCLVLLLSAVTTAQYLLDRDLGIDQVFMESYVLTKTSHPGRMGPNTALGFLLAGLGLAVVPWLKRSPRLLGHGIFSASILALGTLSLFGYFADIEKIYGWGTYTPMALHSTFGFIVLGLGFMFMSSHRENQYLPVIIVICVGVTLAVEIFFILKHEEQRLLEAKFQLESRNHLEALRREISFNLLMIHALRSFYEGNEDVSRDEFRIYAQNLLKRPACIEELRWVPKQKQGPDDEVTFRIRYVEPEERYHELLGKDLLQDPLHGPVILRAVETGQSATTLRVSDDGGFRDIRLYLYEPIFIAPHAGGGKGTGNQADLLKGMVSAVLGVPQLFEQAFSVLSPEAIRITMHDMQVPGSPELFTHPVVKDRQGPPLGTPPPQFPDMRFEGRLSIGEKNYEIVCTPGAEFLELEHRWLAWIALAGTLLVTVILVLYLLSHIRRTVWIENEVSRRTLELAREVTERRQAQKALQKKAAELERSNMELTQFAYAASHDLQEPLRTVASFTQLLQRRLPGGADAKIGEYMEFIIDGAKRMQQLIDDLLLFSRVGKQGKVMNAVDLNEVLRKVLRDMDASLRESDAVIQVGQLPVIPAEESHMVQLFRNLLTNALKFRGKNTPRIEVNATPQNRSYIISVKDNGIGMEMRHFKRIFVIFQRLHTRDAYPGTGIGLAICKKIVDNYAGRITVDSKPGQGTIFYITLPGFPDSGDHHDKQLQ